VRWRPSRVDLEPPGWCLDHWRDLDLKANPDRIEALGATTLLARAAQPDEIASVIAFLASPKANYITGAVIAVDGGRTAI
jgi:NAD(P)-dependent dehydrogenase (short-subunit alcohol dehydrogenase family)